MKKYLITSFIILCVIIGVILVYKNRNIIFKSNAYNHCEELIKLIDKIESPYCKFKFDEIYVADGVLRIEYDYETKSDEISDAEKINAFNQIRTEVNNYLLQNEDFYYLDKPILLEFDTSHGNDDDAYYKLSFSNYNDYSDEITTTLDDVRTFVDTKTSDLQGVYGLRSLETIVSSYVKVDSYLVFENNPNLKYCKIDFENDEDKATIEKLLLECEIVVRN